MSVKYFYRNNTTQNLSCFCEYAAQRAADTSCIIKLCLRHVRVIHVLTVALLCRQSSPASSSGTPGHSQSFMDMLSPMAAPSTATSPLCTPGGRALGRGLDESPCISGSTSHSYSGRGFAAKLDEELPAQPVILMSYLCITCVGQCCVGPCCSVRQSTCMVTDVASATGSVP